jgi:hypothetical protein
VTKTARRRGIFFGKDSLSQSGEPSKSKNKKSAPSVYKFFTTNSIFLINFSFGGVVKGDGKSFKFTARRTIPIYV